MQGHVPVLAVSGQLILLPSARRCTTRNYNMLPNIKILFIASMKETLHQLCFQPLNNTV